MSMASIEQANTNGRQNATIDAVVASALQSSDRSIVEDAIALVDEVVDSMKSQLDLAKTRQFHDPDWHRRINHALRCRKRERQQLQRRLGDLKRAGYASREQMFVNCARQILDPDTFHGIWHEVRCQEGRTGFARDVSKETY